MCELHRRDFLLGLSGLLLYGCADSGEYAESKDYYPVAAHADGIIYHWGKNGTIKIDSNTNTNASSGFEDAFKEGVALWNTTLSSIGITIEYTSSSPDVKVRWDSGNDVGEEVLGYATTWNGTYRKYIVMANSILVDDVLYENTTSTVKFTAAHEFGHMLGLWNHSFDRQDIMYPFNVGGTALSNRDKRTLVDYLYLMTPTIDMHEMTGPSPFTANGETPVAITTYFTTNGCVIKSGT